MCHHYIRVLLRVISGHNSQYSYVPPSDTQYSRQQPAYNYGSKSSVSWSKWLSSMVSSFFMLLVIVAIAAYWCFSRSAGSIAALMPRNNGGYNGGGGGGGGGFGNYGPGIRSIFCYVFSPRLISMSI